LGSKFCFSKLFKKFRKKSCTYLTMARTTLWNVAAKCHRMRPGKKWQISRSEIHIFGSHFMSEICHFCPGRIQWHFATKFYTVVRAMVRYMHDFLRIFLISFRFVLIFWKNREHMLPGAKSLLRTHAYKNKNLFWGQHIILLWFLYWRNWDQVTVTNRVLLVHATRFDSWNLFRWQCIRNDTLIAKYNELLVDGAPSLESHLN
jgi:hypothetical protein